jgi:hypothetical protein
VASLSDCENATNYAHDVGPRQKRRRLALVVEALMKKVRSSSERGHSNSGTESTKELSIGQPVSGNSYESVAPSQQESNMGQDSLQESLVAMPSDQDSTVSEEVADQDSAHQVCAWKNY